MRGLSLALLCALAGCAVGPDYQRPDTDLPASYAVAPGPGSAMLPVPPQWWVLYGDPALDGLIADALRNNAQVHLAAARVEEAMAVLRESGASFYPDFEGSVSTQRSADRDLYSAGVSASFEVDLWGRLRRTQAAARTTLLATRHARDTVALSLAGAVARAYFAARSLDSQAAATAATLQAADESLVIARKRANAGLTSVLDVHQAQSLRASAAAQAKEVTRQRAVVLHELGVLTGHLDLQLPAASLQALPEPPLPPPGLPSELLERRPDVRQAEAALAAATQRIGAARAAQFPALRLTGSAGAQSDELSSLFSGSTVLSVGGLIAPLLDAGRYAARTDQAVARARQAEAEYVHAVRNAFRDVADALSNVSLAKAADGDLAERVTQSEHALHLATQRYDSGYSAYLEVLDAQRTLNDAQLSFLRNRQAYLSFTVDLMTALGGGWSTGQG